MLPRVNILIANYNYGEWVCSALQSACNQKYPNIAITIVDAASTDDSWDKINKFLFRDENGAIKFTVSSIDNGIKLQGIKNINDIAGDSVVTAIKLDKCNGPSLARNVGIKETLNETDIYAILDSDDEYYPDKVAVCVENMLQSPSIGVVYTDYDTVDTTTGKMTREYKEVYSQQRLLQECIVHSGALIRKEAIVNCADQFGFYDEQMRTCEDYDLWIRISEKYLCWHVPESHSLVRVQPKNSTNTVEKSIWESNWKRISAKINGRNNVQR